MSTTKNMLGIDFAPIRVPLERRLQTLAVMLYTLLFLAPLLVCSLFLVVLFSPLFWVSLGYGAWILYDVRMSRTSSRGGRRWDWLRNVALWRYFRDYFPAQLIKTSDLDTNKNYLFGYHPHGIVGCGAFCSFASEGAGFSKLFPGITPYLLTLKVNFMLPLVRAILLWLGVCDVSKESIQWILSKNGSGNAAIIVVGGAEEALNAHPGTYTILLKQRKGFVKQAIHVGASLVPVYGFGENDVFAQLDNPEGSTVRSFQKKFKEMFGFSPPFFYGRGIFNYTFGMLPRRKPIWIVVGEPIAVPQCTNPSRELVDSVHQKYMDQLSQLFDKHKTQYGISSEKTLHFM